MRLPPRQPNPTPHAHVCVCVAVRVDLARGESIHIAQAGPAVLRRRLETF